MQNVETLCHDLKRQKESLSSFWIKVYLENPTVGKALKKLLPFATTFMCVKGFSFPQSHKDKVQKPLTTRQPEMQSIIKITQISKANRNNPVPRISQSIMVV